MAGDWAKLKARQRSTPRGRIYDRARNRALTRLAQLYPDDYQRLLGEERKKVERAVKAEEKKAS